MQLQREVKEVVQAFTGQKSALPHALLAKTDAERIINFVCRKGRLRKIWGGEKYAEPVVGSGSGGVTWLEYFRNRFIYQQGPQIAYEDAEAAATFTGIGTIIGGASARIVSEKWRNRIFMVNGHENKFYEDITGSHAKFVTLGLFPPGNGLREALSLQPDLSAVDSRPGGTLLDSTEYKYLVTFWDNVREVESLPNGAEVGEDGFWGGNKPATVTTSAGTGADDHIITVSIAAIKAAGYDTDRVTHWKLYRATQADPDSYKVVPGAELIAIASDTFPDTDGDDTQLGAVLDESISPPPTGRAYITGADAERYGPRYVIFFRDQLWLFGVRYPGDASEEFAPANGIAYASDVGGRFDYWKYSYDIGRSTDQEDTGMGKYRNTLFFFKSASAYYLVGTNPDNYEIRELDPERGIVAPGSIQNTSVGVIGLSDEGFILFDSASPGKLISEEIVDEIKKINLAQADKIHSTYNKTEGKYECHIPLSPSSNVNRVFIYDVNQKAWQFDDIRFGQSAIYGRDSSRRPVGLLGDPLNSRLFSLTDESQHAFNGQTIRASWASKHFDFDHPTKLKRLQYVLIKARSVTDFRINIDIVPDFGQQDTISIRDISSDSVYSTWAEDQDDADGMVWDQGNWAGASVPRKFLIPVQCLAKNMQIILRESENDEDRAGFEIEEIVLGANLME